MNRWISLLALLLVGGCGLIGKKDEVIDPTAPLELVDIEPSVSIDRIWSASVGRGIGKLHSILQPALDGDRIYVAGRDGRVSAYDADSGRRLWRRELDDVEVTGGVSASNGLVLVGTKEGNVFALEQGSGDIRWRAVVSSEVLAAPATNGDLVVAATIDGKVWGLEAGTGAVRWRNEIVRPTLSLRGNGAPVVTADVAYVGHDNGKVVAYRTRDGGILWEARVAIPSGRTELERLVDIDAAPLLYAGVLYAISYHGGLMAINPETGRGFWYQEASGHNNIGAWGGTIAITEDNGAVRVFNVSDGTQVWQNRELLNRQLNAPALDSRYVVAVDFEGIMHVLNRQTGAIIGRDKIDSDGVRAPMIMREGKVWLLDNDGTLSAWRIEADE